MAFFYEDNLSVQFGPDALVIENLTTSRACGEILDTRT